jgi:hypothetical protein
MVNRQPASPEKAWMLENLLPVSFRPEWGSVELVRAAVALLQAAFDKEPSALRFVLASESCLPILPVAKVRLVVMPCWPSFISACFAQCIEALEADKRSWIYYDIPRSRYDYDRQRGIEKSKQMCEPKNLGCESRVLLGRSPHS